MGTHVYNILAITTTQAVQIDMYTRKFDASSIKYGTTSQSLKYTFHICIYELS